MLEQYLSGANMATSVIQKANARLKFVAVVSYFGCWAVDRASGSMTALTWGFGRWVGAWCLTVAGPTVAQLGVFFGSYCL